MALLPPSPKTQKKIKETLYQDPEVTARDVQHIKDWLSKQPHLPEPEDDQFLERFLYFCKYRLSRCKQVLDMYYTVRGALPEFFTNRDPLADDIQSTSKIMFVSPVPRMTPEGHRLTFLGLLDHDASHYDFLAQCRRSLMLLDAHIRMETWLGDDYVIDLQGATLTHFAKTPPTLIRRFALCLQDAFPVPIKGIHFLNAPLFMDKILSIVKPFLKEKLRSRIHVHTSLDSLYDLFPRDMFPDEYGGQAGSIREINDWWQRKLIEKRDWFLSEEHRVANEDKRVGKAPNYENLFALEGSFKALVID